MVSGAGPTTTSKQLKEIPQQDEGAAVYDVPSENEPVEKEKSGRKSMDNPVYTGKP